jgi:hypothetical protein
MKAALAILTLSVALGPWHAAHRGYKVTSNVTSWMHSLTLTVVGLHTQTLEPLLACECFILSALVALCRLPESLRK